MLPVHRQVLPVQLSPFRPGLSPMGLYQDPEADSSSRMRAGDTDDSLRRRYSPVGRDQGESQRSSVWPAVSVTVPGFHSKHGEDSVRTESMLRVPRFHGGHHQDGAEPTGSKDKKDSGGVRQLLEAERVSARALSRLIGKMNATNPVIPPAPLFYRNLQKDLEAALRGADQDYETILKLFPGSREELIWWDTQMVKWNGRTVISTEPNLTIESD